MRTLLTIGLLIIINYSYSQNSDQKADEILSDFSKKTEMFKTLQAKFIFHHKSMEEGEIDKFNGEITIKDDKFKLVFPGNEIYSIDKTLWQYMIDLNEVTITEKEKGDDSFLSNPSKIFSIYKDEFKYKLNKEYSLNGKQLYEIDLFPKEVDESNYSRIRLTIHKENLELFSIEYYGKDRTNFLVSIKEFKANQNIDDSFFTFNESKYPDIEINDMR